MKEEVSNGLRRQNIEDHMYTVFIRVVEGLVRKLIVEPPNFSFLHSDLLVTGAKATALRALNDEVVAVPQIEVNKWVLMPVDLTVRFDPRDQYPPCAPLQLFYEVFDP